MITLTLVRPGEHHYCITRVCPRPSPGIDLGLSGAPRSRPTDVKHPFSSTHLCQPPTKCQALSKLWETTENKLCPHTAGTCAGGRGKTGHPQHQQVLWAIRSPPPPHHHPLSHQRTLFQIPQQPLIFPLPPLPPVDWFSLQSQSELLTMSSAYVLSN